MADTDLGSPTSLAAVQELLNGQIARLTALEKLHLSPTEEPWKALLGYPFCIRDSLQSFYILASYNRLRDSYVVARTVYETSVSYCYVAAKGQEAVERAWKHVYQKSYRDLSRETKIGRLALKLEFKDRKAVHELPQEVQDALKEFSSRRGDELRVWTPDNLIAQLRVITDKFGDRVGQQLLFPHVAIYRHSSEIAHGSLYGTLWPLGLLEPGGGPSSQEDLALHMRGHLVMLHMMLALCVDAVLRVAATGFPIDRLVTESAAAIAALKEQPWAKSDAV